jgi:TolA-binding protein
MKAKERHQLKENEFAVTTAKVVTAVTENRSRIVAVVLGAVVIGAALTGFFFWRKGQADRAGAMLGIAMDTATAPIAPPSTLPGATQAPGTYATAKARSEAALKLYQDLYTTYPSTDAGLTARYEAAGELLSLSRVSEAETLYNEVIATNSAVYAPMARLALAQAKLVSGKFDEAVKMFTDLAGDRDGAAPVDGVLMQLAQASVKAGKVDEARAAYKRVIDEFGASGYAAEARQRLTALN